MSKKKFRTTYILIAIFAVLFLFVYFFEKDKEVVDEDEIETFQVVDMDLNEIKQIKFSFEDKNTIVEKDGEDWKITKPIKYKARKEKLQEVVTEINNSESEQKFIPENLKDYGLDDPTTTLVFTKNDDEKIKYLVGNLNPQQTKVYVKSSLGDEIYLVDSNLETSIRLDDENLKQD